MLVLSRRVGQRILLPGLGIQVEVVAIRGREVRLGFAAPPGIHIVREELVRNQFVRERCDATESSLLQRS